VAVSDLPDWWDKQKVQSEKILTEWVQENPQWWAVGIAGMTGFSMDLGAGLVDVLRFGEGAAQGGWKGYGKDALRLLVLLGPLARAGAAASRFVTPLIRSGNLRLAVQLSGVDGPCTFQAVNNALAFSKGKNLFVTVSDMAAGVGKRLSQLKINKDALYELGAWIDELIPFLRTAGMRVREVNGLSRIEQVVELAQRETGPVIFAFKTTVRNATGVTEDILHSVIATRTATGAVRFADYGGEYFPTLTDLCQRWGTVNSPITLFQDGISAAIANGAQLTGALASKLASGAVIVMEGLVAIQTLENRVEMAVPAAFVASSAPALDDPADNTVIKAAFDAYKTRLTGKPVGRLPEPAKTLGKQKAPRSQWLTGVQFRLNALGFGCGKVDGINGPRTRNAVIAFQRAYPPLGVDGIPGPRTQTKLVELCGY
jgi:hypothetical protein